MRANEHVNKVCVCVCVLNLTLKRDFKPIILRFNVKGQNVLFAIEIGISTTSISRFGITLCIEISSDKNLSKIHLAMSSVIDNADTNKR